MLCKVKGTVNKADALTKHVNGDELQRHMNDTSIKTAEGRHRIAPETAQDEASMEDYTAFAISAHTVTNARTETL